MAVVICFQFSIFALSKTANTNPVLLNGRLWFAFNLVSLHYRRQQMKPHIWEWWVVICFQFSIFALSKTAIDRKAVHVRMLWFAFNLVSLHYRRQPNSRKSTSCVVVICFQFSIFALSKTAGATDCAIVYGLWFAFNLVSLHYRRQHKGMGCFTLICCDLLSI